MLNIIVLFITLALSEAIDLLENSVLEDCGYI